MDIAASRVASMWLKSASYNRMGFFSPWALVVYFLKIKITDWNVNVIDCLNNLPNEKMTNPLINQWTNQLTNQPTNQPTNLPVNQQTDGLTHEPTDLRMAGQTNWQTKRPTNGLTNRWKGVRTDIQTDRHIDGLAKQLTNQPTELALFNYMKFFSSLMIIRAYKIFYIRICIELARWISSTHYTMTTTKKKVFIWTRDKRNM